MTPWTITHQSPLSMGFSWQEYWSGLPFPSPTSSNNLCLLSSDYVQALSNNISYLVCLTLDEYSYKEFWTWAMIWWERWGDMMKTNHIWVLTECQPFYESIQVNHWCHKMSDNEEIAPNYITRWELRARIWCQVFLISKFMTPHFCR